MNGCRLTVVGCLSLLFVFCGRSVAPPPPPAPAPVVADAPALPATLADARAALASGKLDLYEAGLKALAQSPDALTSRRATDLLALFYVDQNRPQEALPLLGRAADLDPLVAPWMRLRIASIERDAGRTSEAAAALLQVVQQTPASSAATTARIRLPGVQAPAGDAAAAEASLAQAMAIPIDELTEEEFVNLAADLDKASGNDLAMRVRMRLLTDDPDGRFTEQTYNLVASAPKSPLDTLSAQEALDLASKLGRADRYDSEFDLLHRTAQRLPDAAQSEEYRSFRLHALFNSRHYGDLLRETDQRTLTDPSLMLLRARAAWRDDQPQEFLYGLQRIEQSDPRSSEAVEAKILRAKYYTVDEPKLDLAIDNLEAAIKAGGAGSEGETLWTLGWTYVLAKRYDDALQIFDRYGHEFPDGNYRDNALFWTGKIDQLLGKTAESDAAFTALFQRYPYSYYSYRSRQILDEPPVTRDVISSGNIFPKVENEIAALSEPRLNAVRELAWLGLQRDASGEMQAIAAAYPGNAGVLFQLADLYADGGEPFKAEGILERHFRPFIRHGGSGIPHRFWEILYPLKYWDTIRTEAEKRQVDPYLIAAIIRQESGFEPSVVSNAGAVGIMQIMPAEAARIAAAAGLPAPTRPQLFDPIVNIQIGVAEFAQKLAVMHGTPILAIATYNAGEEAVGKWLAQTPVDDMDLFVESIPYNETRLYVKTVTRNRFEYRRIYEGLTTSSQ